MNAKKVDCHSTMADVLAVQRALEEAGVIFTPENGGGAGVRLAKPKKAKR